MLNPLGLLYRPVVDEDYLARGGAKPDWPDGKPFAVCLTHDVDLVSLHSLRQSSRGRLASLVNGSAPASPLKMIRGLAGWGLAEFKYCPKRRDFVFMEINAKLWASIEFAFMNNSNFLKYLFGIDYPEKKVDAALFIDRLVALGSSQLFRNLHLFYHSKILSYQAPSALLRLFLINIIPPSAKSILKTMVVKSKTD